MEEIHNQYSENVFMKIGHIIYLQTTIELTISNILAYYFCDKSEKTNELLHYVFNRSGSMSSEQKYQSLKTIIEAKCLDKYSIDTNEIINHLKYCSNTLNPFRNIIVHGKIDTSKNMIEYLKNNKFGVIQFKANKYIQEFDNQHYESVANMCGKIIYDLIQLNDKIMES